MARKLIATERLRHAWIAIGLAILVAVTTILRPLDITVWSLQAKLLDRQPSGDLVLVKTGGGASSLPGQSENREMARALKAMSAAGVDRVIVDQSLARSKDPSADRELREQLEAMRGRVAIAESTEEPWYDDEVPIASDPYFTHGIPIVADDYHVDFLGYVWGIEPSESGKSKPTVWSALANEPTFRRELAPDYTISSAMIPQYGVARIAAADPARGPNLAGKTVVVGPASRDGRVVKVPGKGVVAPSLIHIIAAETALRGSGRSMPWWWMVVVFGATLLAAGMQARDDRKRRLFYAAWVAALLLAALATAAIGVRAIFSGPIILAFAYAAQRALMHFKRRHLYLEQRSRLPNFVALRRDVDQDPAGGSHAIVVAKVARLDAIFATLSSVDQARYLRQIASRLALGDDGPTIYYDGGKYFAFVAPLDRYPDLQGHLEGLRAVAMQSITVGSRVFDVSITMGVDRSSEGSVSARLSSAIAAADQAREAYRPVFLISDFATDSEEWDHSLQARLEQALSDDRIAIKLQPQAALDDGRIVGVEALARWVDEERGEVPPSRFILQCERVGRLDELTKRILFKSLSAAETLGKAGNAPRMSINVSAIQFVDKRIADLIQRNLATHRITPELLTIEVTETARIENFAVAREVFEEIRQLGVKFSMDDFGVGAANFDAMLELPFDELKIDQKFVQSMAVSDTARAIVANIVQLAADAKLISVAEGIENRETYALLREMGCNVAQGFYIGHPMPLSQLEEMLALQKDTSLLRTRFG